MTAEEYIRSKFSSLGVTLSDADVLDVFSDSSLDSGEELEGDKKNLANIALAKYICVLILHPDSISESSVSISWGDMKSKLLAYYKVMCKRYGLEDELSDDPKIYMF